MGIYVAFYVLKKLTSSEVFRLVIFVGGEAQVLCRANGLMTSHVYVVRIC